MNFINKTECVSLCRYHRANTMRIEQGVDMIKMQTPTMNFPRTHWVY